MLLCQRSYHVESTASRPISEVKQHRVWLVLGWVTAWEHQMLLALILFLLFLLFPRTKQYEFVCVFFVFPLSCVCDYFFLFVSLLGCVCSLVAG